MARFFIQKWTKEKYPNIYKAQGNKEVYAVLYDKGVFPLIIGKTYTLSKAKKIAKDYSLKTLKSKNPIIKFIKNKRR